MQKTSPIKKRSPGARLGSCSHGSTTQRSTSMALRTSPENSRYSLAVRRRVHPSFLQVNVRVVLSVAADYRPWACLGPHQYGQFKISPPRKSRSRVPPYQPSLFHCLPHPRAESPNQSTASHHGTQLRPRHTFPRSVLIRGVDYLSGRADVRGIRKQQIEKANIPVPITHRHVAQSQH